MRAIAFAMLLAVATACGSRQVEVGTGAAEVAQVALHVTNNTSQAVNVYVVSGGNDMFLRTVPAGSAEHIPVSGVAAGSTVSLRASTVGGTPLTYSKSNVVLNGTYAWQIP